MSTTLRTLTLWFRDAKDLLSEQCTNGGAFDWSSQANGLGCPSAIGPALEGGMYLLLQQRSAYQGENRARCEGTTMAAPRRLVWPLHLNVGSARGQGVGYVVASTTYGWPLVASLLVISLLTSGVPTSAEGSLMECRLMSPHPWLACWFLVRQRQSASFRLWQQRLLTRKHIVKRAPADPSMVSTLLRHSPP